MTLSDNKRLKFCFSLLMILGMALLLAAPACATITPTILQPTGITADDVPIEVKVDSDTAVAGVKAQIEDQSVDLVYDDVQNSWVGTISLAGKVAGSYVLNVTATTANGDVDSAQTTFTKNSPPVITIVSPVNNELVPLDGQLHVIATCTDDDPAGCSELHTNGTCSDGYPNCDVSSKDHLDLLVSFSLFKNYSPDTFFLEFWAKDTLHQVTLYRTILIDATLKVKEVTSVPGSILDLQPDRILFLETSSNLHFYSQVIEGIVKIRDRKTGKDTSIGPVKSVARSYDDPRGFGTLFAPVGYLTPHGAIFEGQTSVSDPSISVHEWRDNASTLLFRHALTDSGVIVKGNYAAWIVPGTSDLNREDLSTGSIRTISTQVYGGAKHFDLDLNGAIVFASTDQTQLVLWNDGVYRTLVEGGGFDNPVADGVNVVFTGSFNGNTGIQRINEDGAPPPTPLPPATLPDGREILSEGIAVQPGADYRATNGWTAFMRISLDGHKEIWLRSPQGAIKQMTVENLDHVLIGLGPDGELAYYRHYYPAPLHITDADGTHDRVVGSYLGTPYWLEGSWHFAYGNTAFSSAPAEITPPDSCSNSGKGDVNADGKISLGDVILALRQAIQFGTIPDKCSLQASDVNCDGQITLADAVLILRNFILGEQYPICQEPAFNPIFPKESVP